MCSLNLKLMPTGKVKKAYAIVYGIKKRNQKDLAAVDAE